MQVLGQAGLRLVHDGKGYRMVGQTPSLPVTLRVPEILALLRPGGDDREDRDIAQGKLAEALPAPLKHIFRDPRRIRSSIVATPVPHTVWTCVDEGLSERRLLSIHYRGVTDMRWRDRRVEPHALFMKGTGWYLAAWCREVRDWRFFRMDRVARAATAGEGFEPRPGFDVEAYVKSDIGVWMGSALDAEVEVLPSHVEAVRSEALAWRLPFRRSARGAILEIPRGHVDEAAWWLARFGEGVRVLAPLELRKRLATLGRRMAELNGG